MRIRLGKPRTPGSGSLENLAPGAVLRVGARLAFLDRFRSRIIRRMDQRDHRLRLRRGAPAAAARRRGGSARQRRPAARPRLQPAAPHCRRAAQPRLATGTAGAGSGSITGAAALTMPVSGTRHSNASSRPVTGDSRQPPIGHVAVGRPGRVGRGGERPRHPFARAAFVAALGRAPARPSARPRVSSAPRGRA